MRTPLGTIIYLLSICTSTIACRKSLCLMLPPQKKGILREIMVILCCMFLAFMIIYIGDFDNLIPSIIFVIFTMYFCFEGLFWHRLVIGLIFCSTAYAYNALVDNFLTLFTTIKFDLARCIFWCLLYLFVRHYAPKKGFELSPALWKLLLTLTLTPLGIILSVILLASREYVTSDISFYRTIVLLTIALLSFFGLLWTITVLVRQQELEQQHQLVEMNHNYYEHLEQQQFKIRRLRHDMANHLQILSTLPSDERDSYIQELIQLPEMLHSTFYCANNILNAVLNAKASLMEDSKIDLNHKLQISDLPGIDAVDLCAIFGNSIDNAIEACKKISLKESRYINMEAQAQKGLLVYQIDNPLPTDITNVNGHFITSKKDTKRHGYGIKSIQEIVDRYHGHMEITTDNHIFHLFLYIPLKEV